jgi:hypothetical protein
MRTVPHKSELGKGLKDEPTGLLFIIASLVSIALLLLMVASAKATRAEISPEKVEKTATISIVQTSDVVGTQNGAERLNGVAEQPNSVARAHSRNGSDTNQSDGDALRAAFLRVMASLGG